MCVHCREPRLIFALLTAQPLFTLKMRWAKIKPQFRASACLVFSVQSTQADKRTLIQGVLIHSMCLFEDGIGVAKRRPQRAPSGSPCVRSTSDCAVLLRSRRTKRSGTAFSRFVLQTSRMPFVACNELAIATKSIASVCPHAERTPWFPFNGERRYGRDALSNTSSECVVAKANEADCFANAEVQCPKGRGDVALKYFHQHSYRERTNT